MNVNNKYTIVFSRKRGRSLQIREVMLTPDEVLAFTKKYFVGMDKPNRPIVFMIDDPEHDQNSVIVTTMDQITSVNILRPDLLGDRDEVIYVHKDVTW